MELRKADQQFVRSQNRAIVINLLRTSGPLSRSEIARRTGLAPSALTRLMRVLLEEGVVEEVGKASSSGGRPPTLVDLDRRHAFGLGVKIERRRVLAARVDLAGTIAHQVEAALDEPAAPISTLERVAELIDRLLDERVLGIGVSVSGFVDPETGVNLFSPILQWEDVCIREELAAHYNLPIRVENDVNALALAERWYGAGRIYRHFICITVGEGIGAGVVLNGDIYRGAHGGAGELGHTTIDPNGPICRCRERGCLEVYASDRFLEAEALRLGFGGIDDLVAAARGGSSEAAATFHRMGANLGIGTKNLVNLLNPEAIVLGGERMDDHDLFFAAFEEEVCRHSFPAEAARLEIVPAHLGRNGFLIGAATLPVVELFRLPAHVGTP